VRTLSAGRGFDSRVVWILGSPRSGSTWFLKLLAGHPAVVPINEPLIGMYLSPFLSDLSGWNAGALGFDNFTLRKIQAEKRHQFFAREFDPVVLPALGRMLRERFLAHAIHYPPPAGPSRAMVVVKEPSGSQSADLLSRALPKSRLLFLLRDGRDVVDSMVAANLSGSWTTREFPGSKGVGEEERLEFVVEHAQKWLWRTEAVQEAVRTHRGPTLQIKYECLLAEPGTGLTATLAWLGLSLEASTVESIVAANAFDALPADQRGATKFYRSATPGGWKTNLTEEEQATMEEIIGPKLRELGYSA
jgi:hypothetical protein